MKKSTVLIALTLGSVLLFGTTGCHKRPVDTLTIPGMTRIGKGGPGTGPSTGGPDLNSGNQIKIEPSPITVLPSTNPNEPTGFSTNSVIAGILEGPHDEDRTIFAPDTVYFDTDSAVIKASEQSKLENVASVLKGKDPTSTGLIIEGYCDERGTEGYNLALGDRRSLAVREYLITLGVDAGRMQTISYGEAKAVDAGHNESAWKQNRRGFSVLATKKQ